MVALTLGPDTPILSMFSGFGGLDAGIRAAIGGGRVLAFAEHEPATAKTPRPTQAPARVLAHHHPDIPNLGDVTTIDWAPWRGRIVILSAGFPCQDVSHAGLGAGLAAGTRSGLWYEVARAIDEVGPALVVIENVPGLRSARAGDREEITDEAVSDVEPGDEDVRPPDGGDAGPIRGGAFRVVLDDLAGLGFDAEWVSVRASDVGAPHRRERVFILAYRRDLTSVTYAEGR